MECALMRKPLIAGNWKMNSTIAAGRALVLELKGKVSENADVEIVVAPPFTALTAVSESIQGSTIQLASQNVHWEESGAYTGEISPLMLKDVGCRYAIIGHSERRQYFHETDETVNHKIKATLKHGLIPIVCIGESLEEREDGKTLSVIESQVGEGLKGLTPGDIEQMVIAYEPIWAIGTGKTATSEQAQEVHDHIRKLLHQTFGEQAAQKVRILYGGSVKPGNIDDLMAQPDIDGALVGGASLKADSFSRIVQFKKA